MYMFINYHVCIEGLLLLSTQGHFILYVAFYRFTLKDTSQFMHGKLSLYSERLVVPKNDSQQNFHMNT